MKDALADAEELEALAKGAHAKHEVWRIVGARWHAAGLGSEAGPLFERALRYVPDDVDASAGLGATLIAQGKVARGVALLSRAVAAAEKDPSAPLRSQWVLSLARALAEQLDDRPAAIARLRSIHSDEPAAMLARGLEGRWRASLGDHAGAQIAFATLRELAAARVDGDPAARGEDIKALLLEAANFERVVRGDLASSQAHVATALRLRPQDRDLEDAYRAICAELAPLPPSVVSEGFHTVPPEPMLDEQRAEELIVALRARPDDDSVVDELSTILFRLGRSHELLALLSARIEDASEARRELLRPMQITVLARLEKAARERGHDHEAQLFRDALSALGGVISM
jgi:tetratricopeptide (TPR) repeat protein